MNPRRILLALVLPLAAAAAPAPPPPEPAAAPAFTYHLTAWPWRETNVPASAYLDIAEPIARALKKLQNDQGQVIDPYEKREVQYSTAYFAYGVAVLTKAGRGDDLLDAGVRAMDSATDQFFRGAAAIDNQAGEFVIAPLTEAIEIYASKVPAEKTASWKKRMSRPLEGALRGLPNNWQAYAMRGEWLRARAGLTARETAQTFVENSWTNVQAKRLANDPWGLYHDESSDPDALAVDPVGRANLMGLILADYDGPSAAAMKKVLMKGALSNLFLQDPTGQAPGGGRSSGHVWNDLVTLVSNEQLAEIANAAGDAETAGRCRRAADLSLQSLKRWQRPNGTFWVTKNRFDPADHIGYSQASFFTNYNAALLFHLAEVFESRRDQPPIAQRPAPAEVGGYVLQSDAAFAALFANAGGMQLQGFLRGATQVEKKQFWTTLGITRISRAGWDSRLGALEATRNTKTKQGVSFAPTFKENSNWIRLSDVPERYQGHLSVRFISPNLSRFTIDYTPTPGHDGPTFSHVFVMTPDSILSTLTATGVAPQDYGVTLPLLEDDGSDATDRSLDKGIATVRYREGHDQLAYLAMKADGTPDVDATLDASERAVRGGYGDIRPVRCVSSKPGGSIVVYPRSTDDPSPSKVAASFKSNGADFSSLLGRTNGNVYVGRTSAGGFGERVDLNNDGKADVTFSEVTGFLVQFDDAGARAVETDRDVDGTIAGRRFNMKMYVPVNVSAKAGDGPPRD